MGRIQRRSVSLVIAVGVVIGLLPSLGMKAMLAPLAAVVLIMLIKSPFARAVYFVFGSLFIFQSQNGMSTLKIGFVLGLVVVISVSAVNLSHSGTISISRYRAVIVSGIALLVYVLASFMFSLFEGDPINGAFRGIAPYVLFCVSPIIAKDIADNIRKERILVLFFLAGTAGTVNFTVSWLSRRGIDSSLSGTGLASMMLPAMLFSFLCAAFLLNRTRKMTWSASAALTLCAVLVTGTRSALMLLLIPIIILLLLKKTLAQKLQYSVIWTVVLVLVIGLCFVVISTMFGLDLHPVTSRLREIATMFNSHSVGGQSFVERRLETFSTWHAFLGKPMIGNGPYYKFFIPATLFSGSHLVVFTDSPFVFIADYGIVGAVLLLINGVSMLRFIQFNTDRNNPEWLALGSFFGFSVLWMVMSPPFQEKSFSVAVTLLVAMFLSRVRNKNNQLTHH